MKKIILQSGAFIGLDGSPIRTGLGADLDAITEPLQDWRCHADAQIILAYVQEAGRLFEDSVEDLAGAIYASRDDDRYGVTVNAIRQLLADGKLTKVETNEGITYQVLRAESPVVPAESSVLPSAHHADDGNGKALIGTKPR